MNNFKKSLDLFIKISDFYKSNEKLKKEFYFDGYDLWSCFQMLIFLDIKKFFEYGNYHKNKDINFFINFKNFILYIFLFIVSFFAFLKSFLFKKDAIVFSIDLINSKHNSDKRIEYVYDFLKKEKIKFIEVFHTTFGKKPVVNFLKRKRSAFYLETFDFLYPFVYFFNKNKLKDDIDFGGVFLDKEIEFVKKVFLKYRILLKLLKLKMKAYAFIFSFLKVKYIFMIDDTRYYFPIIYAGKKNNIKTMAFQHGHFTKYHIGWLDYLKNGNSLKPDKIFVFSNYWKNELLRIGSYFNGNEIEVMGYPNLKNVDFKKYDKNYIGVLIPYETEAPKKEVLEYIKKITACENVRLFFKLRTDISKEKQKKEYFLNKLNSKITFIENIDECMEKIDIVCGVYSSFLYDMIAYEKSVFVFKTSMDYGEGMVKNGLAEFLDLSSDVCFVFDKILKMDKKETKRKKDILYSEGKLNLKELKLKINNV